MWLEIRQINDNNNNDNDNDLFFYTALHVYLSAVYNDIKYKVKKNIHNVKKYP